VKLPGIGQRRRMYYSLNNFFEEHQYKRSNVWSFVKNPTYNFSSVTRNYYLGLGASSGSYNGKSFYFNTFSVPEYIKTAEYKLPVSLVMKVSEKLQKSFWLYWQLYETTINKNSFKDIFSSDIYNNFGFLLHLLKIFRFISTEDKDFIKLNTRGSHWIHLLQNYYALDYVNKIWSISKNTLWPEKIRL
jgi:oxygen-independent coproporphyrinogen-3 oxidase